MREPAVDVPPPAPAEPATRPWTGRLSRAGAFAVVFLFLGVDYVDTEPEALAYLAEFGITYLNGPDLGTRIAQAYRIRGVPETFFIDKGGPVRWVKIGPLIPPELEDKIEELLAEDRKS